MTTVMAGIMWTPVHPVLGAGERPHRMLNSHQMVMAYSYYAFFFFFSGFDPAI